MVTAFTADATVSLTAKAAGFLIATTWEPHAQAGGMMDAVRRNKAAIILAGNMILALCSTDRCIRTGARKVLSTRRRQKVKAHDGQRKKWTVTYVRRNYFLGSMVSPHSRFTIVEIVWSLRRFNMVRAEGFFFFFFDVRTESPPPMCYACKSRRREQRTPNCMP